MTFPAPDFSTELAAIRSEEEWIGGGVMSRVADALSTALARDPRTSGSTYVQIDADYAFDGEYVIEVVTVVTTNTFRTTRMVTSIDIADLGDDSGWADLLIAQVAAHIDSMDQS